MTIMHKMSDSQWHLGCMILTWEDPNSYFHSCEQLTLSESKRSQARGEFKDACRKGLVSQNAMYKTLGALGCSEDIVRHVARVFLAIFQEKICTNYDLLKILHVYLPCFSVSLFHKVDTHDGPLISRLAIEHECWNCCWRGTMIFLHLVRRAWIAWLEIVSAEVVIREAPRLFYPARRPKRKTAIFFIFSPSVVPLL